MSCFNPRAHGRRDFPAFAESQLYAVSTHAPTGGATLQDSSLLMCRSVSTHAPTGGATRALNACKAQGLFQPTRPREARPVYFKVIFCYSCVSTHAPTGGATPTTRATFP